MITPVIQVPGQIQVEGPAKPLILPTDFVGNIKVADTTPSVKNAVTWIAQNTSPLVITQFDDGQDGQVLYILGDGFTTVADNANIKNNNGNDTLLEPGAVYTYKRMVGVWYQLQGNAGSTASNGVGHKLVDWTFAAHATAIDRTGWTASASASGSGQDPSKAIDGNIATRWATGALVTPGTTYWGVDMGAVTTASGLQITQNPGDEVNFPTTGDVQWSDTSATGPWTTIASWTTANIFGTLLIVNWAKASHRYWRVLAQSTPAVSGNWDSISEINFFNATWHTSNQTWKSGPLTAVWFEGVYAKSATSDVVSVGIGYDVNNMYALYHGPSTATVLLVKIVGGTQTTLASITVDNDTSPHEFELELIVPSGPGQNNWITARVGRTSNPQASVGIQDSSLDFTSQTVGTFTLYASTDTIAKGCNYFQLPSTTANDALCTIATGGDYIYQDGAYRVHVFTNNGTFTVTQAGVGTLDIHVVGGGGGGNGQNGGASGDYKNVSSTIVPGSYTVGVGVGGTGGSGVGGATSGASSSFDVTTANGGGAAGTTSGGAIGVHTGGTSAGASGGCIDSPPASIPCNAGAAVGGGGASFQADGTNAVIIASSYDCTLGQCVADGEWGAGGSGTHITIKNPNPVVYNGFDIGSGGFGSGSATGSGGVSGPARPSAGGQPVGDGGDGTPTGAGLPGGNGIVIVRYPYDPLKCG